jgi:hypothetical protein
MHVLNFGGSSVIKDLVEIGMSSDGSFFQIAVFLLVYADRGNLELISQRVMEMARKLCNIIIEKVDARLVKLATVNLSCCWFNTKVVR